MSSVLDVDDGLIPSIYIYCELRHMFFFRVFVSSTPSDSTSSSSSLFLFCIYFWFVQQKLFSSRMFCVISAVALWLRYAGIISFHSKLCSFINNICCYFDECLLYVLRIYNNTYERAAVSICLIPYFCQSWYYFLAILLTFDALYQSKSVHNWHEESQFILLSTSYAFSMINEKCNLFRSQLTSSARRKKYVE